MRLNYKTLVLCFCLFMAINNPLCAQENPTKENEPLFHDNAIYGSIGIGGYYVTLHGFYEHLIQERDKKTYLTTLIRAGFGYYGDWGDSGFFILVEGGFMTGARSAHLEAVCGINYFIQGDRQGITPAGSIGFRLQKPKGHFIFRTGIGYPEGLYFGIGFCF